MKHTEPMLREGAFEGKTIIVTGGGTGLGKSMATYMSQLGANIVIASRKQDVLDEAAKEISAQTGGKVLPIAADVRDYEAIEKVLEVAVAEFGEVTGLLNNAAGNFISPTERLSHRAFESVLGIVLQGTINYTLAVGKYWIDKGIQGNILSITTTYAETGSGYVVPSACAKAGVIAMTRSLAAEWGFKYKIRVNAISPGPFPTKGAWDRLLPGDLAEKFAPENKVPMGRVGDHQELANLAAYVMSDYAAYLNGEVLVLDGGEWLQNAGQFSGLSAIPDEMWDMLAAMRK